MTLKWTDETPTEAGWYWTKGQNPRSIIDVEPSVVAVRWYNNQWCISNWAIPTGHLWAGPIQLPEEED